MRILNNVNQVFDLLKISKTNNKLPIESIVIDSKKVITNSLFFGLPGANTDGSKYYKEALSKAASLCIIKEGFLDKNTNPSILECHDVLFAMSELSKTCRRLYTGKVIGITGSNGKTTTKEILKRVLPNAFATEGNLNNEIGVPINILNLEDSHFFAAIEMGASKVGDIKHLSSIALQDIGIITSIGRSHISGFGSIEAILKEKSEIIRNLPEDGLAVVPFGEHLNYWNSINGSKELVSFGLDRKADCCVEIIDQDTKSRKQRIELFFKQKKLGSFHTKLLGTHNALNLGSAFAVCKFLGIELEEFSSRIENLTNISNRLGINEWINDSLMIDDTYNANPDSTKAALAFLSGFKGKKKIAVLGDMLELGSDAALYHSSIGEIAKKLEIDILLGFGDMMQYAVKSFGTNGIHFTDEAELKEYLKQNSSMGKVFLLKGSRGMKMERFKTI
ncbi:MAG: UDP-N-acetylmuramoyl-tripeptide--D-alanyl-D-alanine ligase [Gammaproteobacteria bacterium]